MMDRQVRRIEMMQLLEYMEVEVMKTAIQQEMESRDYEWLLSSLERTQLMIPISKFPDKC